MPTFGFNINSAGAASTIEGLEATLKRLEDMNWNVLLMQDETGTRPPSAGDQEEWPPYHLSKEGREFIIRHETIGGKPNLRGYPDIAKHPTIGYGHEIMPGENFSNGITMTQALALLGEDVQKAVGEVNRALSVPLAQNQFDALVDLAYNEGPRSVEPGFEMMDAVNQDDVRESNFTQYDFIKVRGRYFRSRSLFERRVQEWLLFEEGKY